MNLICADFGRFFSVTDAIDAREHQHWMLQLFLPDQEKVSVCVQGNPVEGGAVLVGKGISHAFSGKGLYGTLLVDSTSEAGRLLEQTYLKGDGVYVWEAPLLSHGSLSRISAELPEGKQSFLRLYQSLLRTLGIEAQSRAHMDSRITHVCLLAGRDENGEMTPDDLAKRVHLSQSRLSHLFRQETGMPLKSYLVTLRLVRAINRHCMGEDLTRAALDAGFDSLSHFSAACKRMTGMNARAILKDSMFLKVFEDIL